MNSVYAFANSLYIKQISLSESALSYFQKRYYQEKVVAPRGIVRTTNAYMALLYAVTLLPKIEFDSKNHIMHTTHDKKHYSVQNNVSHDDCGEENALNEFIRSFRIKG